MSAQGAKEAEPKVIVDSVHRSIAIDFSRPNMVYNLLIHINDSTGTTIFLENQYRFKGHYNRSIDMQKPGKGTYFLEVIEDNKHTNKKIVLK
jgi:hypothetical protein